MGARRRAGSATTIRQRRGFAMARIGMAVISVVAIAATGAGWWVAHHTLGGITVSQALGADDPRSTGAAVNILLIGLDSRKDQQGNDLPPAILDQLHAGDSDAGGYNTNALILVHLSADNKVTAFSVPRDDYVAVRGIPGYSHIKIKEAYGLAKANAQQKLSDRGVTGQQTVNPRTRSSPRAAEHLERQHPTAARRLRLPRGRRVIPANGLRVRPSRAPGGGAAPARTRRRR